MTLINEKEWMYSRDCMVVIPFFKWWFGVEEAVVATALRSGLLVCSRPGLGYHCNWGWRLFFPWSPLSNVQTQRLNLFLLWILVTWSTREYLAHNIIKTKTTLLCAWTQIVVKKSTKRKSRRWPNLWPAKCAAVCLRGCLQTRPSPERPHLLKDPSPLSG